MASKSFFILCLLCLQCAMNVSGLDCYSCVGLGNKGGLGNCGSSGTILPCNGPEDVDKSNEALQKSNVPVYQSLRLRSRQPIEVPGGKDYQCFEAIGTVEDDTLYIRGCTNQIEVDFVNQFAQNLLPTADKVNVQVCNESAEAGNPCNQNIGVGNVLLSGGGTLPDPTSRDRDGSNGNGTGANTKPPTVPNAGTQVLGAMLVGTVCLAGLYWTGAPNSQFQL